MFNNSHVTSRLAGRSRARALETWREAADLVDLRWRAFVEADAATRTLAFASYTSALDAEEAAAGDMAVLCEITG